MRVNFGKRSANEQRHPETGFTIIEVLIVLAVAGLIMLIVFQAIPTLTRNSRNNQRRQDVTAVLEAVSHYELNNSATFPTLVTDLGTVKLSYYGTTNITLSSATQGIPQAAFTDTENIKVLQYQKCDPDNVGATLSNGASYTDIVAQYAVENGGSGAPQCQQL